MADRKRKEYRRMLYGARRLSYMYEKRIANILEKLELLKQADSAYTLFGANKHRYELAPVWSAEDVEKFEDVWKVTLPGDYRAFLMQAGSSGAGPYYGLVRPEDGIYADLDHKDELNQVSGSFPYTEAWNDVVVWGESPPSREEMQALEEAYFSTEHSAGMLSISNFGCGVSINLVVNGQSYGEIWVDDRSSDYGIHPDHYFGNTERLTFLDWYETWLDRSLEKMGGAS
jgi:hypothetical protein